jgi:alpha-L-fucosidase
MERVVPLWFSGCLLLTLANGAAAADLKLPIAEGAFQPSAESLKQYQYPDWFRDAKFGIWAHWGPQAVPMDGDWYARGMYEPGNGHYNYHVQHYGHPSEFGYKDIIPLWKAEKWDPDRLMGLYKKAGAKYFVSMGSHHDNFFLWNSKLHRWNAVNMGPHRDVVGEWQKAAMKYGLKFGVSEHLGASFTWFQSSHRADTQGPKAGVPYDGANPEWQDLYHFPAEPGDTAWYSTNPRWQQQWFNEIKELVDMYHPDLLYSDGRVPFGNEVGLSLIAHLYNDSAARHGGHVQVVYNCKQQSDGRWVEDLERGIMPRIDPYPWQTDTSIGDWFYSRNWKYRPVSWVIHMLVDNVSKNGNLLLNVVQRPDGSLDPEVEQMLGQLADWNAIHGEAIFGTRPWLVYGETGLKIKGGSFGEDFKYNAREVRFTTKGETLYAFTLGWPEDRQITIRSLAQPQGSGLNRIEKITLLGYSGKLDWKQAADGLTVTLPEQKVSEYTAALKITGSALTNVPFAPPITIISPDDRGRITLSPDVADTEGGVHVEMSDGQPNFGYWDNAHDSVSWNVRFPAAGRYKLQTSCACLDGPVGFVVELGAAGVTGLAPQTGDWNNFRVVNLGSVTVQSGQMQVRVRSQDPSKWNPINLRAITLTPE